MPGRAHPVVWRLTGLALAALLAILSWLHLPPLTAALAAPESAPRQVTGRGEFAADERATIEVFERTRDSVVFIRTKAQVRDPWTRNVFSVPRGTGSGFVWDQAGHIVTNFHVVQGASEATVKLANGRDYRASLVGASPAHDLAVLRIGVDFARPLPVPIGTSHDLRVGQKVYAIGNPFGLDWSLTTGIVSALDRSLDGDNGATIEHLIQTDAAINPGNSGGPLLDSAGRLIGITTAIYSPSGASAGIGFAVPVDTVNRVVPQLIRHGRYHRPVLGIEADESLNQRLAALLGVEGIFILRVRPGSGAAAAGLRAAAIARDGTVVPGDVIVAVEDKPVTSVGRLDARLDDFQVGETVRVALLRNGARIEIPVRLQSGN